MRSCLKYISILAALALLVSFAGCSGLTAASGESGNRDVAFHIESASGVAVQKDGNVYTVTRPGEYVVTGRLEDGRIVVNAGDEDEVILILENASVSSAEGAPIECINAAEVTVRSAEGSSNEINDLRSGNPNDASDQANAAIWSACDLKLTGKGALSVNSKYDNGVKSKDDLSVKNVALKVNCPGVALKGNDSVTIKSGSLILVSTDGDGVKTSNSDLSAKGNQRGDVTILGGSVNIYAACDGISAAHDVLISEEEEACAVNVYTAVYSKYAGNISAAPDLYLVVPAAFYLFGYDYYFYFYNDSENDGVWEKCSYDTAVYTGKSAKYFALMAKVPDGYQNFLVNIVVAGTTPNGSNYSASSDGEAINRAMNAFMIDDVTSGVIIGEWATLSAGSGSTNKTTYSSKGIKADNAVFITSGTVEISCMDDGVHASAGKELENGAKSVGDVDVSGGSLTITASDDGIHADGSLTISGGSVNIVQSHEGLEGNVITFSDGDIHIYGNNDGINARIGSKLPQLIITGGYIDVASASGDTDGIDINGFITMSGGFVLVKGGNSGGVVNGSVDADATVTVTGGTIVALGGVCELPTEDSVNTYVSSGTVFNAGEYTLVNASGETLLRFELSEKYTSCWIASESLVLDESYHLLQDGVELLSWTQSSALQGFTGHNGAPGGSPGGSHGGAPGGHGNHG